MLERLLLRRRRHPDPLRHPAPGRRFDLPATELLGRYTVPAVWEKVALPVAKLKMAGKAGDGACVFLDDEAGCTVYEDRPATCRYYPLGLATIKMKDAKAKEDFHFLVKESQCKGLTEDNLRSVSEFRHDQGIEPYDEKNRGVAGAVLARPHGLDAPRQTVGDFDLKQGPVEQAGLPEIADVVSGRASFSPPFGPNVSARRWTRPGGAG